MREAAIPTPARQIIPGDSIKPAGAEGWGTVTAAVLEAGDIVRLYVDNAPAPGSFLFDSTTPVLRWADLDQEPAGYDPATWNTSPAETPDLTCVIDPSDLAALTAGRPIHVEAWQPEGFGAPAAIVRVSYDPHA